MYTIDTVPTNNYRAARDLHPGDVVRQLDWSLHVQAVTIDPDEVVIAVAEFGFPLHYTSGAQVQLAA